MTERFESVLEFRVELRGIKPAIWRRIQVPGSYTFWDLHSAIQDAMGWLDGHLHAFVLRNPKTGVEQWIGIPDPDSSQPTKAGWEEEIRKHFVAPGHVAEYLYDFGDGWEHKVTLQKNLSEERGAVYPRCLAGKRAGRLTRRLALPFAVMSVLLTVSAAAAGAQDGGSYFCLRGPPKPACRGFLRVEVRGGGSMAESP